MSVSERLAKVRTAAGISMRKAALDMDFPYTTYVGYENGRSEPNSAALVRIAAYFGVTVDYLVGASEVACSSGSDSFVLLIPDCCKECPHMDLKLNQSDAIADCSAYERSIAVFCSHQAVCKVMELRKKKEVPGDA